MKRTSQHRISARLLAFVLVLVVFNPGIVPSAEAYNPAEFDASNTITGAKVITQGGTYLVTGTAAANSHSGLIRVETADPVALILDGAEFTTGATGWSPLMIGTAKNGGNNATPAEPVIKANVTIILAAGSDNKFQCNSEATPSPTRSAGIDVSFGSTLTIQSEEPYTNPGKLTAVGGFFGAGIGSGPNKQCGTIIIESGIVEAESSSSTARTGANSGVGIGGGGGESYNGGYRKGRRRWGSYNF